DGAQAAVIVDQAQQQVLGPDPAVVQDLGLFLGPHDDLPRPVAEPLEHAASPCPDVRCAPMCVVPQTIRPVRRAAPPTRSRPGPRPPARPPRPRPPRPGGTRSAWPRSR